MIRKLSYISVLVAFPFFQYADTKSEETKKNSQNSQLRSNEIISAELFDCCSLKDLNSFAMHPLYSILSSTLKNKVMNEIIRELEKIGKVIKLEVPDPLGYGKSQAYLSLSLINISINNGSELPIIQTSFNVDMSTIIKKQVQNV